MSGGAERRCCRPTSSWSGCAPRACAATTTSTRSTSACTRASSRARELQAWALNRYYYQTRIPIKDALIVSKSEDPAFRRVWIRRIHDHDGDGDGEGAASRCGCGSPRRSGSTASEVASCRARAAGRALRLRRLRRRSAARARWSRRSPRRSPSSSRPTSCRKRIAAWEKHYPWVGAEALGVLPRPRAARAPRRRGGARFVVATRRRASCRRPASRRWCARPRSSGTCSTACRRRARPRRERRARRDRPRPRGCAWRARRGCAATRGRASTMLLYPEKGPRAERHARRASRRCAASRDRRARSSTGWPRATTAPAARADRGRGAGVPARARASAACWWCEAP